MKLPLKSLIVIILLAVIPIAVTPAVSQLFVFENPLVGEKAPDFTLKNLKGDKVSLSQARNGEPSIVFFWATWCPHCRQQLKELNKQQEAIAKQGLKIILVDVGENASLVSKHLSKNNIAMDVLLDEDSEVSANYGLIGVPTFFFIDKEGTVKAVEHFLPENYISLLNGEKK